MSSLIKILILKIKSESKIKKKQYNNYNFQEVYKRNAKLIFNLISLKIIDNKI